MTAPKPRRTHLWDRDEHDWYVEPIRPTTGLLRVEAFDGPVWDSSCGGGNIVRALQSHGLGAVGSDVVDRGSPAFAGIRDFLTDGSPPLARNVVNNPPFFRAAGAEAFIRRALALVDGKVATFVDIRFIAGTARAKGLFAEHPPSRIWIVTPRVSCPPGSYLAADNKAGNGSSDWCWLVWDRTATGPTQLGWLQEPFDVFA